MKKNNFFLIAESPKYSKHKVKVLYGIVVGGRIPIFYHAVVDVFPLEKHQHAVYLDVDEGVDDGVVAGVESCCRVE